MVRQAAIRAGCSASHRPAYGAGVAARALQRRVRRLAVLATVSILIGVGVQFIEPLSGYEKSILLRNAAGAFWYFLLMGTAFLISGALTLYSYVGRMPPRDLEAEMPRSEQL